jgi:hypothetical protein
MAADGRSYPMTVELQQKNAFTTQAQVDQNNANATQPIDVLVKAGVLSVSNGTKKVALLKTEWVTGFSGRFH